MDKIIWTEDFSVGVEKLDNQHKKIINLINQLIESPAISVHSSKLDGILAELLKYSIEHLRYEEKLLKDNAYPDFEHHKNFHDLYTDKVTNFSLATLSADSSIPPALLIYLKGWWERHILDEDMKYKPFFESKGIR